MCEGGRNDRLGLHGQAGSSQERAGNSDTPNPRNKDIKHGGGLNHQPISLKMTKAVNIEGKVKAIIYDKLRKDEKGITLQSSFKNDFGADSLDMVELVMEFEKEFNITIRSDEAEKITTVGEAVEYIRKNLERRAASKTKS